MQVSLHATDGPPAIVVASDFGLVHKICIIIITNDAGVDPITTVRKRRHCLHEAVVEASFLSCRVDLATNFDVETVVAPINN